MMMTNEMPTRGNSHSGARIDFALGTALVSWRRSLRDPREGTHQAPTARFRATGARAGPTRAPR